jgi:transposase
METTLIYPKAILGIDVSKSKLDCHLVPDEAAVIPARRRVRSSVKAYRRTVSNTEAGVRKLQEWMKSKGVEQAHVCLEPTSTYHELAFELLSVDHCVSVVNARAVRHFADAMELVDKTDRIDAMVLAEFCRARRPVATRPLTEAERELRELSRRRTTLVQQAQQEANRLESTRSKLARSSIQRTLKLLAKERAKIEAAIHKLIQQDDKLCQRAANYQSIQGVGTVVSATMLAEVPDLQNFDSARQAAAYLGVVPSKRQSGSSLNRSGGITKRGNTRVRAVLYMAGMVGMRTDPVLRAFAERLRKSGKKTKVIIVAVMRKLVHILYGIAKSGEPRRLTATV